MMEEYRGYKLHKSTGNEIIKRLEQQGRKPELIAKWGEGPYTVYLIKYYEAPYRAAGSKTTYVYDEFLCIE